MKYWLIILILLLAVNGGLHAQRSAYPEIGAQIFIEPGQSAADIEEFFSVMERCNMTVGRIRLFGAHMLQPDGTWDYALYDTAFDAAQRHGVKLFATLFPPTDLLSDVGGFKFPSSAAHLKEIAAYIEAMVTHFASKPALYAWVLQNEPGLGSGANYKMTEHALEEYEKWKRIPRPTKGNGYLAADFSREEFLVRYTDWYLEWIARQVELHDPGSSKHINPHQIFDTLTEYDFASFERYLTSLGISMHFSWHFGLFGQERYPLGVSVMADIIRTNAGDNPFWITEMQGGNVTASGYVPYCPTESEISRFLWTGIGAGAEGIIFWTLNQRKSAVEAGEWGLIDFYRRPTGRLQAAARVASLVERHKDFFRNSVPAESAVTILYNNESLWIQRRNWEGINDEVNAGRHPTAPQMSMVAAYEAIAAHGTVPAISPMDRFDWENGSGRAAVITDMVSLPSRYWESMRRFVQSGGKLIVTGLTGFYDENMQCLFMDGFPLEELFGGGISEYKFMRDYFTLTPEEPALEIPAHLWLGIIESSGAEIIGKHDDHIFATRNSYGDGEVIWFPSLIELGVRSPKDETALREFYGWCLAQEIGSSSVRFSSACDGVFMRVLENSGQAMTVLVNRNPEPCKVTVTGVGSLAEIVDGDPVVDGNNVEIGAGSHAVCLWNIK